MTNFVATCISGVESLVRGELERQDIQMTYGQDKMVAFEGDMMTLTKANIWSRVANRIYIEVEKVDVTSLEMLFAVVESLDWSKWIPIGTPIMVSATTSRSVVTHTPSMQSIGKKAIIRSLMGGDDFWKENEHSHPIEVFLLLVNDELHVLINTSGDALHKRGYRSETGEAPLKESLAAALVLFSGWKFRTPLYDPMCGSGTLLIEAAMIARNIAPGLQREFDYLYFPWYHLDNHEKAIAEARKKIFDKSYQIFGSDRDEYMIDIACKNASRAGVLDTIQFRQSNMADVSYLPESYIITNPPYGKRLDDENLEELYTTLEESIVSNNLSGGVITLVDYFPKNQKNWTKKNLMNGAEKCQFWRKMS
ncbi:class I SAM-dependent RNA methyltransferase [Candidatus Gracilibacteria bacterium]|nr:class I SAM-dependent RNA methyltransferase [Candidatus Gracilibacteria bacterium]